MKILSAKQFRDADHYTILNEPVNPVDLMERAALACFNWIVSRFQNNVPVIVFCGPGNNGGDGLAIARMLHDNGFNVSVYMLPPGESVEVKTNLERLVNTGIRPIIINDENSIPQLFPGIIIIDALFGTGISRTVVGTPGKIMHAINNSGAVVISIDMPSGMIPDAASAGIGYEVVKATHTLTFEAMKLSFLFSENNDYTGDVVVLPIGLSPEFINSLDSEKELTGEELVKSILKKRSSFSHKGNFGHALLVAGSFGKMGAAVMATHACLRTGAGLTTAYIPSSGYSVLQSTLPEAMVACDEEQEYITNIPISSHYNSSGIGPGLGKHPATAKALNKFLEEINYPVVLDADALNIISENNWHESIPRGSIITPHPGEFIRLFGKCENNFDMHSRQLEYSERLGIYIILKGKYSCITTPSGKSFFNPTGNPGMAKGGSGDVLTGMITSLIAQGYKPEDAAIAGVYLHGLAADIAVKTTGEHSLLARDIIKHIPSAYRHLTS